ncbi:winged helix-turn-helix domain-containing protein [uncultured Roseobacter sp.]|uniref:winged helix-turn-helix domain-containing tetratricopeptide repeat protein n=1 Tax=uncultured Roseobacter sp. TaxID=114847 RepID=UPI0026026996|nr:winged helix-turn-helix domain-containing protein [uncultured Roseobacter sp.]
MKARIADTEVDFDQMTATRDGTEHRLTRQTLGILSVLHGACGGLVSKDQLINQVWHGRIVTDATLSTAIKEARRAVGDSGSEQRVIKTVHGVGFQLTAAPDVKSPEVNQLCIAVLPFRNIGSNPEDQFISDGLTDELLMNLSRFRDLKVLARNTTESIRVDGLDHAGMSARYAVDYAIEGSVRRAADRLRVTVQLTSTLDGTILITEQFDREATPASLFDVQDQIAALCAGRLAGPHGAIAASAVRRIPDQDWTMFQLVAQFREFYRIYDPDLHAHLRDALPTALAETPDSADGWAAYAVVLLEEHRYHVNERPGIEVLPLATDAAERAIAADPQHAFAYVALAMCRLFALDIVGFDAAASRALSLNPSDSDVLSEVGHCYAFLAREDEAIRLLDKAMDISPVHPGWYHFAKTWRYARLGMYDAALLEIQAVPTPGFYWYHAHVVWLQAALGDLDAARVEAETLLRAFPAFETNVVQELQLWQANADLVQDAVSNWRKVGLLIEFDAATGRPADP